MHASLFQLVAQAGWFVKMVLGILAVFSVGSWSIILYKAIALSTSDRQSARFMEAFHSGSDWKALAKTARACDASPLARLFEAATAHRPGRRKESLERVLKRQSAQEIEHLYAYVGFLANTGSTAPFVGLLGTVWGIMDAFRGIGSAGSASLAVVAPAIAEALIATAAGLIAAIPAVMAYNYFLQRIGILSADIEDFAETLAEAPPENPA